MESVAVVVYLLMLSSIFMLISLNGFYAVNDEGKALYAFKKSLSNDTTEFLNNWNTSDETPCKWKNVHCNNDSSVTEINLASAGLFGKLGSDLAKLTNLSELYLFNNSLVGNIPNEFGNLTNLQTLELFSNGLMGEIPKSLSFLLSNNMLSGTVPTSWNPIINKTLEVDLTNNKDLTGDCTTQSCTGCTKNQCTSP